MGNTESRPPLDDVPLPSLDETPIPTLVHQDGKMVFLNKELLRLVRELGYVDDKNPIGVGAEIWGHFVGEDLEEMKQFLAKLVSGERLAHNVTRVATDGAGNRYQLLGSCRVTTWLGRPAFLTSFICTGKLGKSRASGNRNVKLMSLTPRERQIAFLVAQGCSNENIAADLAIGLPTVRSHLKAAYRKTCTTSRVELVRFLLTT
ncbi:MAG: LuxR C-terminal-related transcriptional regulator [Deltaproteobacteria bacterium]|nr:LuxR C-terminal-related transcriptional regulator [Deltaproteobacteria bacterium]